MDTITTGLRELSPDYEELPLSVHTVVSSDDLLNEILLKLPAVSLILFKSVCKHWLSLIKDAAFVKRRSRIPNIDPLFGLFIKRKRRYLKPNVRTYGTMSFDIRIPSRRENIFKTVPGSSSTTSILESCNGLFLCFLMPSHRYCVYNPTLNLFKVLPEPHCYEPKRFDFARMDFDPTKSPHYKVMHTVLSRDRRFQIQIYSSETGFWTIVCSCIAPPYLHYGIYWNDAIHWISYDSGSYSHYKLDFGNKNIVRTQVKLPVNNSCWNLYKSRGCLLLIGKVRPYPYQLINVYEMRNGHSEWSMKYSINHTTITQGHIRCITLGEREEDSCMVVAGGHKRYCLYLYNFVLKTFRELSDLQSILPAGGHNRISSYLFIASFASV